MKNVQFRDFRKWNFLRSKKACFLSRRSTKHIFSPTLHKNKQKKFKLFTKNGNFYGLKRLVFYLKEPQATYLELISINTNNKKISNFSPNSWKMFNFGTLENGIFYGLKRLVFYLEDPQTTFFALICIKRNNKKV